MWTQFWDMHSGGSLKEKWNLIYIEAPIEEAKIIFYNRFGHNPDRVTCSCCGSDYSIDEGDDLAQLTGFHRNCVHGSDRYLELPGGRRGYKTLEEFMKSEEAFFIFANEIAPEERIGEVPQQGWVWV